MVHFEPFRRSSAKWCAERDGSADRPVTENQKILAARTALIGMFEAVSSRSGAFGWR